MQQIEIDDEVYAHLAGRQRGFEAPNSVIRRELKLDPDLEGQSVNHVPNPNMTAIAAAANVRSHQSILREKHGPIRSAPQPALAEAASFGRELAHVAPGDGLSRLLVQSQSPNAMTPEELGTIVRTKGRRTRLSELVDAGTLTEGETLIFQNYKREKVPGITAIVHGDDLNFRGRIMSMSVATALIMKSFDYENKSYRGPDFWVTDNGDSIRELWAHHIANRGNLEYTGSGDASDTDD